MVEMIKIQCAQCGANMEIEEDRKICFCTYCGAKMLLDDGTRSYTYRHIDEARIKEAEVNEKIRLKELEIEKDKTRLRNILIVIWITLVIAVAVFAVVILLKDRDNPNSLGYMLILIDFNLAVWPVLFYRKDKTKDKKE